MDIVFVFDESGSTEKSVTYTGRFQQKFALQREFVIDTIDQFASIGTGAGETSFGLVGFADGARIIQPMTGQRSVIVAAVESRSKVDAPILQQESRLQRIWSRWSAASPSS